MLIFIVDYILTSSCANIRVRTRSYVYRMIDKGRAFLSHGRCEMLKKLKKGGDFVRIFRFYGHFSMWRLQLGAQKTLVFSSVRQTKTCYLYE